MTTLKSEFNEVPYNIFSFIHSVSLQSIQIIDILYTLDSASNYSIIPKIEAMIADSGYSHEMRRFVCFLVLKHGT
jgi:hypothetical protein